MNSKNNDVSDQSYNVDDKTYNETIPILLSDVTLIDYVIPNAQNQLEILKWIALKDIQKRKRDAVTEILTHIQNENHTIDAYLKIANIFTNHRKGVLDIEFVFQENANKFLNNLKNSLNEVKTEMNGKNKVQQNQNRIERLKREMVEFEQMFTNEYKGIIRIIFGIENEFQNIV